MGIFGGIARFISGKPPKLFPGEVVRWASVPTPGIIIGTLPQRPYAVKLDSSGQEILATKRWLERQTFTDAAYMGAWRDWVEAQGARPQPPFPDGSI